MNDNKRDYNMKILNQLWGKHYTTYRFEIILRDLIIRYIKNVSQYVCPRFDKLF